VICQALARASEPWPYCMCQQKAVKGEEYCPKHLKEHQARVAAPPDGSNECWSDDEGPEDAIGMNAPVRREP
jgi:hypothetical protein